MRQIFTSSLSALVLVTAAGAAQAVEPARFRPIPAVGGASQTNTDGCWISGGGLYGTRVSGDGRTVVASSYLPGTFLDSFGPTQPMRWTEQGGSIALAPSAQALFNNNEYAIQGVSRDGSVIFGENWRWRANGGLSDLRTLLNVDWPPLSRTIFGCSADGRTVVGIEGSTPQVQRVFLWTLGEEPQPRLLSIEGGIPQIGAFVFPSVSADATKVAGSLYASADPAMLGVLLRPAIWHEAQAPTLPVPSQFSGLFFDISGDGQFAVGSKLNFPNVAIRVGPGGVEFLPGIDGGEDDSTAAYASNFDGSVVVGSRVVFGQEGNLAAIWTPQGSYNLQDLLEQQYGLTAELAGWRLTDATDVSEDGRTIVGYGVNPEGCKQAWAIFLPGDDTCPADANASGIIDSDDIFAFLALWFEAGPGSTCPAPCPADINASGDITADDIFAFLGVWFESTPGFACP